MGILDLLSRVEKTHSPVFKGEWGTLAFRPDLGSQQEFIIGVTIHVDGDVTPHVQWLPSFSKISALYGEAISSSDIADLIAGSEYAMSHGGSNTALRLDTGTPHVRIIRCGRISTDNVEGELRILLKRQAGALWVDTNSREPSMGDDWAYSVMREALATIQSSSVFVPSRRLVWNSRELHVGLDNGRSFGNIVSARYANALTVERHLKASLRQVVGAHNLTKREQPPALFVVLPAPDSPVDLAISKKTHRLLQEIEDMGVSQFSSEHPDELAKSLGSWASLVGH